MFETERFVQECLAALNERSAQQAIQELVRSVIDDAGGIEHALGTPAEAGITTLHRSDRLTILNVIWAPLMQIYPHDHRTWAVIGIYGGQEDNAFYRRRKDGIGLDQVNARSLNEKEAMSLGQDAIHTVYNPRHKLTGAIHVYGGDFFALPRSEWDSPQAAEQAYSVEHTLRVFAEANAAARPLLTAD